MNHEIKSIPQPLDECYGNLSELSRRMGIDRKSVAAYQYDTEMKMHVVFNGILMRASNTTGKVYRPNPSYKPGEHRPESHKNKLKRKTDTSGVSDAKAFLRSIGKL